MASLKIIFICSLLFASVLANKGKQDSKPAKQQDNSSWEANAQKVVEECRSKLPADSEDELLAFMREPQATVSDKNVQCLVKCVGEGWGLMNAKDGKLITANIQKQPPQFLDAAKLKDGLKECTKVSGKDACETSMKQYQCLLKTAGVA